MPKRTKLLSFILIVVMLSAAIGFLPKPVNAFFTDMDPFIGYGDPIHNWISNWGLDFLRPEIVNMIKHANINQDYTPFQLDACGYYGEPSYEACPDHHFVGSMFRESASYINQEYRIIQEILSQQVPDEERAAHEFGYLLHTVQDFYAHSNWVEIWTDQGYYTHDYDDQLASDYFLYEPELGYWHEYENWEAYHYPLPASMDHDGIILAETYPDDRMYMPADYTSYIGSAGITRRIPHVVVPQTDDTFGTYEALVTTAGRSTYEPFDMDHDSVINKDKQGRPYFEDAYQNAIGQTRHEFHRLLNLTKGTDYEGSSAILTYWLDPTKTDWLFPEPSEGSVSVDVYIYQIDTLNDEGFQPGIPLGFAFNLYDGDFEAIDKIQTEEPVLRDDNGDPYLESQWLRLNLDPSDTLVLAIEPWEYWSAGFDDNSFRLGYDFPLDGVTLCLRGENLRSSSFYLESANFGYDVEIRVSSVPVAEADGPYVKNEGERFTLSAGASSDFDGTITSYGWDLDRDGQYDDSTEMEPDGTWLDDFEGAIGLKVTDDDGISAYDTASVTIENVDPAVEAGPGIVTYLGQQVTISASYTDPGVLDTHTFEIDWGDDTSDSGLASGGNVNVSHTYTANGTFVAALTVTDDDGGTDTDSLNVKVMTAQEGAQELSYSIQDLSRTVFKNSAEQRRVALSAKIDVVIHLLRQNKYREALNKLILDIRPKTDGFWGGDPTDDWITDRETQRILLDQIDALISYIQTFV